MIRHTGSVRWTVLIAVVAVAATAWLGLASAQRRGSAQRALRPRILAGEQLAQLPIAAQEVISRTLGRHAAANRAVPTATGWRLRAGELSASLPRAGGVEVRAPEGTARVSLAGFGSGSALSPLGRPRAQADGNRVVYDYGDLTATYAAGPFGVEQTFRLPRPPAATARGPVELAMRLSDGLAAHVAPDRATAAITDAGGKPILRYGGLAVNDAGGHPVRSWLSGSGATLTIRIDDSHARYPLRVDPLIQAGKLVIAGTGEGFGQVAVSGDTIIAGAPQAVTPGNPGGAVFVFTKPTGGWDGSLEESAVLTASDGATGLGADVATSGSTIVAKSNDAAYVFTRPAGGWLGTVHQAAKLTPSAGGGVGQLALPAPNLVVAGAGAGHAEVSVFTEPTGGWAGDLHESATLAASDGATLGAVSLAATPDTVVAGAPEARVGSDSPGAAYVFTQPAGGWSGSVAEAAKLTASDVHTSPGSPGFGPNFGEYVALSGNTVAVGDAPGPGVSSVVYVFARPAGGWHSETESAHLTAPGQLLGPLPNRAFTPAVSGAEIAVPGSSNPSGNTAAQPEVFVYEEPAGGWAGNVSESAVLETAGGASSPVTITPDGIVAGGATSPGGDTVVGGSAFVFVKPAAGWSGVRQPDAILTPAAAPAGDEYVFTRPATGWASGAQSAGLTPSGDVDPASLGPIAVSGPTVAVADRTSQSVFVFSEPPTGWTMQSQVAQLRPSDGSQFDDFGASVAISGGTIAVSAPNATVGNNMGEGAAYLFTEPAGGWSGSISQAAKLVPSDGSRDGGFARSLAISGDTLVAAGAEAGSGANGYEFTRGEAYVFAKPAGGWTGTLSQTATLAPAPPGQLLLGASVAVSGSEVAVLGTAGNAHHGVVYLFEEPAGGWAPQSSQAATLVPADGSATGLVSMTGSTVFVAGSSSRLCKCSSSRVFVFGAPAGGWSGTVRPSAELVYAGAHVEELAASAGNVVIAAQQCSRYSDECDGQALDFAEPPGGWSGALGSIASTPVGSSHGVVYAASTDSTVFLSSGQAVGIDTVAGATAYRLPTVARHRLTGVARGTPRLALRVAASTAAPALRSFRVWLPKGLSFTHRRGRLRHGVSVSGARGRTVHLNRGRLEIGVRGAEPAVTLRFRAGILNVAKKYRTPRHHGVRRRKATAIIEITDAAGNTIPVAVTLRL